MYKQVLLTLYILSLGNILPVKSTSLYYESAYSKLNNMFSDLTPLNLNGNYSTSYTYDKHGNMTKDLNRGISHIAYNSLNLPSSLTISNPQGSATNTYVYAADGRKLSVSQGSFKTDYVSNMIYEQGIFKRLLVDGGYYQDGMYYFYIQDHLGNNRIVANQNSSVVQSTQYYPFGMAFADGTNPNVQPYKFGGKELDDERGLNWYDQGARPYDPIFGRTPTPDPHAENYYSLSPYSMFGNNPMRFVDPTGEDIWEIDHNGNVKWMDESKEHTMYALNQEGNRTGASITVKDRSIFDQLTLDREPSDYQGNYAITKSSEVGDVFLFAANNTEVEWGLQGYQGEKSREYILHTQHGKGDIKDRDNSREELTIENQFFDIHSHPDPNGTKGGSGYGALITGDRSYIIDKYYTAKEQGISLPAYYVYHKQSKGLYQYTPWNSSIYIKTINNNNGLRFIVPKQ